MKSLQTRLAKNIVAAVPADPWEGAIECRREAMLSADVVRERDEHVSDATKDSCEAERQISCGAGGHVLPSPPSRLWWSLAGKRLLPSPPTGLPPPAPPAEKSCCSSTESVASSDESTDCVSEPSERLDAAGSEIDEHTLGIWANVEMDFDSFVFELSPDDVWETPSSIRMLPRSYDDEADQEVQRFVESDAQGAVVAPSCAYIGYVPVVYPLQDTCGNTRLNSRARPWTPSARVQGAPTGFAPMPSMRRWQARQVQGILAAMQVAMASSGLATKGEIFETPSSWAVTMYVHAAYLVCKEQVINLGKAALIGNCKPSQSTFVLGYCRQPFVVTPMGFSAILCDVEKTSDACWNLVQHGFCPCGKSCKRCHPKHQMVVNVMIKIKESG